MDEKICLSVKEASESLGISRPTMYRLIHSEGFPVIYVAGRTLIHKKKLEEWAAKRAGEGRADE